MIKRIDDRTGSLGEKPAKPGDLYLTIPDRVVEIHREVLARGEKRAEVHGEGPPRQSAFTQVNARLVDRDLISRSTKYRYNSSEANFHQCSLKRR